MNRHFGKVTPGPNPQRYADIATTSIARAPNQPLDTNRDLMDMERVRRGAIASSGIDS